MLCEKLVRTIRRLSDSGRNEFTPLRLVDFLNNFMWMWNEFWWLFGLSWQESRIIKVLMSFKYVNSVCVLVHTALIITFGIPLRVAYISCLYESNPFCSSNWLWLFWMNVIRFMKCLGTDLVVILTKNEIFKIKFVKGYCIFM